MNGRTYKWLVARGNITVIRGSTHVIIEADPEGSAYCVMTVQDAIEIANFVAEYAQALWAASNKMPEPQAVVEGDARAYKLQTESGVLSLVAHDTKPLVALVLDGQAQHSLTITQAVALVQLIQHTVEAISAV